jgi:hypothetical protein
VAVGEMILAQGLRPRSSVPGGNESP